MSARIPFVRARATVMVDQKAGPMKDRRTKRLRDRSTRNRVAVQDSRDD